jgi:hypothetical protein
MGRGTRDNPAQQFFPFPPPQMSREKEKAGEFVLNVS